MRATACASGATTSASTQTPHGALAVLVRAAKGGHYRTPQREESLRRMNIALCYESVLPAARRLRDLHRRPGPASVRGRARGPPLRLPLGRARAAGRHSLPSLAAGRRPAVPAAVALRRACLERPARSDRHDVSVGFDKTWGQDVLYPQGGLHAGVGGAQPRQVSEPAGCGGWPGCCKALDLAHWSFARLERRQYLGPAGRWSSSTATWSATTSRSTTASPPKTSTSSTAPSTRTAFRSRTGRSAASSGAALGPGAERDGRPVRRHELPAQGTRAAAARGPRLLPRRSTSSGGRVSPAGRGQSADGGGIERLARRLGIADHVRFLGHCADMRNCLLRRRLPRPPDLLRPLLAGRAGGPGLRPAGHHVARYNGASELLHPPQDGYVVDDPHDHEHLAWCLAQLLDPARRRACARRRGAPPANGPSSTTIASSCTSFRRLRCARRRREIRGAPFSPGSKNRGGRKVIRMEKC